MKTIVSAYIEKFLHDRRERLKFGGIVLLLAVIVVGIVFWRLSYVGVAMTNEVYCGQEEHTHDDSCYDLILTCGLEESEGTEGHIHDEDCYETVSVLVCGLEESEGHIHDDSCLDENGNLICAIPETEGHIHSEVCYETTQNLICGLEESAAEEGHTHTDECYTEVLTCGMEEHVHTISCLMDETADLETADDWTATLPEEEDLTGVWAEDVVSVAESQLGYAESEANFVLDEDGETRRGYTRYGQWYGNEYGDWSAMFASFCLYYGGVSADDLPYFPYNSGAYPWTVALTEAGLYEDAGDYTPAAGDLVFLNTDERKNADTVAVISEVVTDRNDEITALKVIQGDHNDAVEEYMIEIDDETILGYGVLPEQPEEETETKEDLEVTDVADAEEQEEAAETAASGEIDEPVGDGAVDAVADDGIAAFSEIIEAADGSPVGGILSIGGSLATMNTDGIMPLDLDGNGDVIIKSVELSDGATYDPERDAYHTHFKISFIVNSDDLEYDEGDGEYDELELVLPDGVDPSEFTGTYVGYVMDSSGNQRAGFTFYFQQTSDGNWEAVLIFEEGYYNAGDEECWLEFDVWVSSDNMNDEGQLEVGYGDEMSSTGTITPGSSTSGGDVSATKTAGEYDEETGEVTYTIVISSTRGTDDNVTITDVMTIYGFTLDTSNITLDGIIYSGGSFNASDYHLEVTDNGSGSYTISIVDSEGNGLPAMGENTTYTITYTVKLDLDEDYIGTATASNGLTVTSKDKWGHDLEFEYPERPTITVDHNRSYITKNGYLTTDSSGNKSITWTITVNTGNYPADIAGWLLVDGSFTEKDNITIRRSDGNLAVEGTDYEIVDNGDGTFTIRFLATDYDGSGQQTVNKNSYTITYIEEVEDDPTLGEQLPYENDASFGPTGEEYEGIGTTTDTDTGIEKSHSNSVTNDDGTVDVNWSITVDIPEAGIKAGAWLWDRLGGWNSDSQDYDDLYGGNYTDQWYTADQILAVLGSLADGLTFTDSNGNPVTMTYESGGTTTSLTYGTDYVLYAYDKNTHEWVSYSEITEGSGDTYTAWGIYFLTTVTLSDDAVLTIDNITSTRVAEATSGGFFNIVEVGHKSAFAQDGDSSQPVTKTDANGNSSTSQIVVDENSGTLTWIVTVDIEEHYDGTYVVIDTLPEGTTLESVTIGGNGHDHSGTVISRNEDGTYSVGTYYYASGLTYTDEYAEEYIQQHPEAYGQVPYQASVIILDSYGNVVEDQSSAYDENGDLKEGYTQQIIITLPEYDVKQAASVNYGWFTLTYTVKLSDDDIAKMRQWFLDGNAEVISYGNTVEVTYDDSMYGSANQTQDVNYGRENDLHVTKTLVANGEDSPVQLFYSVLLNPDAEDLLTGQGGDFDWLEFWDQLKLGNNDIGLYASLNPTSVSFREVIKLTPSGDAWDNENGYGNYWYVNDNGVTITVSYGEDSTNFYVTYDDDGNVKNVYLIGDELDIAWKFDSDSYTLSATIPDETAILVSYTYDLGWTEGKSGTEAITLTNEAHLKGDADESYEIPQSEDFIDTSIQGGILNGNEIDIYKVDENSYGTYLNGATFALYWYQDGQWVPVETENGEAVTFTSDNDGIVRISQSILDGLGVFKYNTGYYLVETSAPEGYILPVNPAKIYFYWSSTDTSNNPISYPNDFTSNTEYGSTGARDLYNYNYPYFLENEAAPPEDVSVTKNWEYESDDGTVSGLTEDEKADLWATVQLYYYLSSEVPDGWWEDHTDLPASGSGSGGTVDPTVTITVGNGTVWRSETVRVGDTVTIFFNGDQGTYSSLDSDYSGYVLTINGQTVDDIQPVLDERSGQVYSMTYTIPSEYVTAGAEIVLANNNAWNYGNYAVTITATSPDPDPEPSPGDEKTNEIILEYDPYTDAEGHTFTVTLNERNNWTATFSDLPEYWIDSDGNVWWFYYYFVEIDCSEDWNTYNATYSPASPTFAPNDDGTYTLVSGTGVDGIESDKGEMTITNRMPENERYTLPSSGGPGLAPFYALGAAFLAVAGGIGLKISRKRRKGGEA